MTPLILVIVSAVMLVAAIVFIGMTDQADIGLFVGVPLGVLAIICLCVGGAAMTIRSLDVRRCENLGERTGREVRFVETTSWSWNCYGLTDNGWVPVDQIVGVEASR